MARWNFMNRKSSKQNFPQQKGNQNCWRRKFFQMFCFEINTMVNSYRHIERDLMPFKTTLKKIRSRCGAPSKFFEYSKKSLTHHFRWLSPAYHARLHYVQMNAERTLKPKIEIWKPHKKKSLMIFLKAEQFKQVH